MRKALCILLLAGSVYANASDPIRHALTDTTQIEMSVQASCAENTSDFMPWKGSGMRTIGFEAHAVKDLSDADRIWGSAAYEYGRKIQIKWNETSDFMLLYPYLTADSLGGNMNSERYLFEGGYSHRWTHAHLGGQFRYRALQEYRSSDPRPLNVVADLTVSVVGGWVLDNQYILSSDISYRRYKQNSHIDFYSEIGSFRTYNLTGLGTWSYRFSGNTNQSYYRGNGLTATVDIRRNDLQGWQAEAAYELFAYEKILPDINNITLCALRTQRAYGDVQYQTDRWLFGAEYNYELRKGYEYLYGDAAGNAYNLLARQDQYYAATHAISAHIRRNDTFGRLHMSIEPIIGLNSHSWKYKQPLRLIETTHITSQLRYEMNYTWLKQHKLAWDISIGYDPCITQHNDLTTSSPAQITHEMLTTIATYLRTDRIHGQVSVRFDLHTGHRINWFVGIHGAEIRHLNPNADEWQICLQSGITL
ncbi:MAG: hypothetical protein IJ680_02800 [Paludibacteraceae bacterium]|nr:hypothetical protein [Paludibacteraceae bacterium]